jgi:hypothetical protein
MLQGSVRIGHMMIGGVIRAMVGENILHLGPVSLPVAVLDGALLLGLLGDALVRYTRYLRDEEWAGGFLEWVMPRPAGNA